MSAHTVERVDSLVLGGGVMGLSIAYSESLRGRSVAVVDPSPAAHKASWAAAGILVTRGAKVFRSAFREFYVRSIESYPEWIRRIEADAGTSVRYLAGGDFACFDRGTPGGEKAWTARLAQLEREKAQGFEVHSGLPEGFPLPLRARAPACIRFPDEAYLNNRALLESLRTALRKRGARFVTAEAERLGSDADGAFALWTGGGMRADQMFLAAGAWTGSLVEKLGYRLSMIPVKGQVARLPQYRPMRAMAHFDDAFYLVPRDGDWVAGATTEPGEWAEDFNDVGDAFIREALRRWLGPEAAASSHLEQWSGIRPRTQDRLPLMGSLETSRVYVCAGHYKCGISMAPLAGACASDWVDGREPAVPMAAFAPLRPKGLRKLPAG